MHGDQPGQTITSGVFQGQGATLKSDQKPLNGDPPHSTHEVICAQKDLAKGALGVAA
jgi:hypothetical protein